MVLVEALAFTALPGGSRLTLGEGLITALAPVTPWIGISWVAFQLVWGRPPAGSIRGRHYAMLGVGALALVLGKHGIDFLALAEMPWMPQYSLGAALHRTPRMLTWILLLYASGYGIAVLVRSRERGLEGSRLETELARSQLASLKSQLQPHFLFNTLNAISSLVRSNPRAAERMIMHLGDLLRTSLSRSEIQEVKLHEELPLLQPYVEIARVRFGGQLELQIDVSPELGDAVVPHLVLQPIVENALGHGLGPKEGIGRILISAMRKSDKLILTVEDNGALMAPAASRSRRGIALANILARMERLYGPQQSFLLRNVSGQGVR